MQEKIANLEIKIFYDSTITKKKKGRELSKPQCGQREQQAWVYTDGGGAQARGVTTEGWTGNQSLPQHPLQSGFVQLSESS